MPIIAKPINAPDLIQFYKSGEGLGNCAKKFRISVRRARSILKDHGVSFRTPMEVRTANKPKRAAGMKAFWAGADPEKRATMLDPCHSTATGANLREYWNTLTSKQRKALTKPAHDAIRGKRRSEEELVKRAKKQTRMVGHAEEEFVTAFRLQDFNPEPQRALGIYNIDIAVNGPIAVELATQGNFHPPFGAKFQKRVKHIRDEGYCLVFVVFRYDRKEDAVGNLEDIITFLKQLQRDETLRSKNWVIRCGAERYTRVRNKLGQLTAIPTPIRFFNTIRELDLS